ncbi:MAG: ribonuclease HI [Chloroflexi bacterium]|nr:ribonuclease HI [Chloroflexota bacterium]
MNRKPEVTIYSDGACWGNPGPGGWAAILISGTKKKEISGAQPQTTNNRMEITAALEALRALRKPSVVHIFTDSSYLVNAATTWMPGWKARGWRRKEGVLLNADLWQELDEVMSKHQIQWTWVKGHAGNRYNERADALANEAIRKLGLDQAGG